VLWSLALTVEYLQHLKSVINLGGCPYAACRYGECLGRLSIAYQQVRKCKLAIGQHVLDTCAGKQQSQAATDV
jgi:hypothetical protein